MTGAVTGRWRRWAVVAAVLAALVAVTAVTAIAVEEGRARSSSGESVRVWYVPPPFRPQPAGGDVAVGPGVGAPGAVPRQAGDFALKASPALVAPVPWWPTCQLPQAATSSSGVTATGMGRLDLPATPSLEELTATISVQADANAGVALSQAKATTDAVVAALIARGVARSAIHVSGLSVWGNGGRPDPLPVTPAATRSIGVEQVITAEVSDPGAAPAALDAALAAGASSVSLFPGPAAPQPSTDAVTAAVKRATAAAHDLAQAAAAAAGVHLGALHTVQVSPPVSCGWGPTGPELAVTVTVDYAVG